MAAISPRRFFSGTTALILAAPLAAEGQQAKKVYRIGYLSSGSAATNPKGRETFVQGLRDLAYVEGRDFVMEYRFAGNQPDRLPALATDLVRVPVDVIVTFGTPATRAAMQATGTIPIVSPVAGSLVEKGFVKSLASSARRAMNTPRIRATVGVVGGEVARVPIRYIGPVVWLSVRSGVASRASIRMIRRNTFMRASCVSVFGIRRVSMPRSCDAIGVQFYPPLLRSAAERPGCEAHLARHARRRDQGR